MRVSLACALFIEPDFLMLDEPTNHLDFPSVMWLTEYLQQYNEQKILMCVSHDRHFLDAVCTDILHLNRKKIKCYTGNYTQFMKTREEQRKEQAVQYRKQEIFVEHQKNYIARFSANKKLSSMAQSRQKVLDRMARNGMVEAVDLDRTWKFTFPKPPMIRNKTLLDIKECDFGYYGPGDPKTLIFNGIDLKLEMGEVIGILGANGSGKSTLLKLIMEQVKPTRGKCFLQNACTIGFFAQHHMEVMDVTMTPMQYLRTVFPTASIQDAYAQLGRFHINQKTAGKKIATLSGGEKSRVAFSILTWYSPHLIIMDEPTNHLDMITIDALIYALQNFEGAVVVVSHDQYFLDGVCSQYWAVGNRKCEKFTRFSRAKRYSYRTSKPLDCLPREFATVEVKKATAALGHKGADEGDLKVTASGDKIFAADDSKAAEEIYVDCMRTIQKAIDNDTTGDMVLKKLQGTWEPRDGQSVELQRLVFSILNDKYFHRKTKDVDPGSFFAPYVNLCRYMMPEDHQQSQIIVLKAMSSCWKTAVGDESQRALKQDSFAMMVMIWLQMNMISLEAIKMWVAEDKDRTFGRKDALGQLLPMLKSMGY